MPFALFGFLRFGPFRLCLVPPPQAPHSHRASIPPNTKAHTRGAITGNGSLATRGDSRATPHQPPSQSPSHVAACPCPRPPGAAGAGAARIDRGRASARGPQAAARVAAARCRSASVAPCRASPRGARAGRDAPRQQQLSGAAWRKRPSSARSWGAGARRWARRARPAHARGAHLQPARRVAARACGGLGWRSSRASPEARRTRARRERVSDTPRWSGRAVGSRRTVCMAAPHGGR